MSLDFDALAVQLATVHRWPKDLALEALASKLEEHGGALHRNAALTLAERTGWSTRQLYRWRSELISEQEPLPDSVPFVERIDSLGSSAFRFDDLAITMLYLLGGNMARFRSEVCDAGFSMPSLATLSRRWRDEVPRHVRDGARHGQRNRHTNLFFVRHSAEEPDEAWQLDAFDLDLRTLVEVDDPAVVDDVVLRNAAMWVKKRPQLLLLIDDASRFITAWAMMGHAPTAADTCALLADAFEVRPADDGSGVLIGGLCERVVCDNASSFRSYLVEGMLGGFGVALSPTPAYSPAAKGKVERVGQTIQAQVVTGIAGVVSASERLNKGHALDTPARSWLELPQVEEIVAEVIYAYNYDQIHSALGMTPFEAYSQRSGPRGQLSDAMLAEHYLPIKRAGGERTVQPSGVHCFGEYWLDPQLNPNLIGTKVQVRSLHHRLDRLALFSGDDFEGMAVRAHQMTEPQRRGLMGGRISAGRAVSRYSRWAREALERRTAAIATGADASPLTAATSTLAPAGPPTPAALLPPPAATAPPAKRRAKSGGQAQPRSRPPRQNNDTSKLTRPSAKRTSTTDKEAALDAAAKNQRPASKRNPKPKKSS